MPDSNSYLARNVIWSVAARGRYSTSKLPCENLPRSVSVSLNGPGSFFLPGSGGDRPWFFSYTPRRFIRPTLSGSMNRTDRAAVGGHVPHAGGGHGRRSGPSSSPWRSRRPAGQTSHVADAGRRQAADQHRRAARRQDRPADVRDQRRLTIGHTCMSPVLRAAWDAPACGINAFHVSGADFCPDLASSATVRLGRLRLLGVLRRGVGLRPGPGTRPRRRC